MIVHQGPREAPRIGEVVSPDWRGSPGEDSAAPVAGHADQVHDEVQISGSDRFRGFRVVERLEVDELVEASRDAALDTVLDSVGGQPDHLEAVAIVMLQERREKQTDRVVVELGREVAHPDPLPAPRPRDRGASRCGCSFDPSHSERLDRLSVESELDRAERGEPALLASEQRGPEPRPQAVSVRAEAPPVASAGASPEQGRESLDARRPRLGRLQDLQRFFVATELVQGVGEQDLDPLVSRHSLEQGNQPTDRGSVAKLGAVEEGERELDLIVRRPQLTSELEVSGRRRRLPQMELGQAQAEVGEAVLRLDLDHRAEHRGRRRVAAVADLVQGATEALGQRPRERLRGGAPLLRWLPGAIWLSAHDAPSIGRTFTKQTPHRSDLGERRDESHRLRRWSVGLGRARPLAVVRTQA